jgi:hypothetical protein
MIAALAWWQLAVPAQAAVTLLCAGLTAGHFLRSLFGELTPGRRLAAVTLMLTATGAAVQAVAVAVWAGEPLIAVVVGLPACAGQALSAVLVLEADWEARRKP